MHARARGRGSMHACMNARTEPSGQHTRAGAAAGAVLRSLHYKPPSYRSAQGWPMGHRSWVMEQRMRVRLGLQAPPRMLL